MIRNILTLGAIIFLAGCFYESDVQIDFKSNAENYCKSCGGLARAYIGCNRQDECPYNVDCVNGDGVHGNINRHGVLILDSCK